METSRRGFVLGTMAAAAAAQSNNDLTANEVIARIKQNVGVPWRDQTVDTIKSGGLSTHVKGIATTMMATLDVVQRAAAAGRNMVITHEPTFYSHEDRTDVLKDNATYDFKQKFLDTHDMVVFRFHDHWHARRPDGIAEGMTQALGWQKNRDPRNPREYLFDNMTLESLARQMETTLKIRTMRVIGDPTLRLRRVGANWGYASSLNAFAKPDLDALIIGEAREWELAEFAADTVTAFGKKALIVLGHIPSEQAGMRYCAEWLKSFVPEVPVEFIAAAEPFWSPNAPPGAR
jgi:putative NIF3 family GTP cyclohydrolase 1 type 2